MPDLAGQPRGFRPGKRALLATVLVVGGVSLAHYATTVDGRIDTPEPLISEIRLPSSLAGNLAEPALFEATAANPTFEHAEEAAPSPSEQAEVTAVSGSSSLPMPASDTWREHRIQSGESLALIFKEMELSPGLLHNIVNSSKTAKQLASIRPGENLRFLLGPDNELKRLELHHSRIDSLHIVRTEDGFQAEKVHKEVERRTASAHGTISSSLFVDGQTAGLGDAQIMELAGIFGWDIDFALELRSGDQFSVIYEERYLEGEKLSDGPILAAEFVNRGTLYRAVRYEDKDGNVSYYDPDGRNKRRAFIRTPVKFARVSSGFNPNRMHPVHKTKRPHRGVDYAAPTGTPIKAAGAGKVVFRGWKGGYGRVVIIDHAGKKYSTLYAHMSKFAGKVENGSRVQQGQVIGYVGMSGTATGPHLHYEFRVNGVHRNPLTVKLPKSLPLPKEQLALFKKHSRPLLAQLDTISSIVMVAEADTRPTP